MLTIRFMSNSPFIIFVIKLMRFVICDAVFCNTEQPLCTFRGKKALSKKKLKRRQKVKSKVKSRTKVRSQLFLLHVFLNVRLILMFLYLNCTN